jgi:hypothetical protein
VLQKEPKTLPLLLGIDIDYISKCHLMLHVCDFVVLWTQNNIHTLEKLSIAQLIEFIMVEPIHLV